MTTIALKGFSTATAIFNPIVNFFEGFGKAVVMARGAEANYHIAEQLKHEYPDMSVAAIQAMLNDNLRKEVYGD
jgi:hypothetical protein